VRYLLDTVVLSELRKRERSKSVLDWLSGVRDPDLFLSVVTIGEIERGIRLQQRKNQQFSQQLADWLDGILSHYAERILPIDIPVARRWGVLSADAGNASADLLVAATALEHGMAVVTRNQRHFEATGVTVINPF